MSSHRPALRRLAERAGILASYQPMTGARPRHTKDATREALLAAMGLDASTEASARKTLAVFEDRDRERLLAPARVEFLGTAAASRVPIRLPSGRRGFDWRVSLEAEDGAVSVREGRVRPSKGDRSSLRLPEAPSAGYYALRVEVEGGAGPALGEQRLAIAPRDCVGVREVLGRRRAFGLLANLYALRGSRSWGIGDLSDLSRLAALAGEAGAAFVGVNPLHALWNRGARVSPYSPVSRLYRNELYLDVEAIPELAGCDSARRRLRDPAFAARLADLRARESVAYDDALAAKREILRELHQAFARGAGSRRRRAYETFREREGAPLEDFATFLALAEHHGTPVWRRWPARHGDARSIAVRRFREEHAEEVDRHCWVQFELERQLAAAADAARDAGLPIGLYQDLAVGAAPDSSDTWAFPGLFAEGATVGAPPDDFSPTGQDWGLPPLVPHALRETGFAFWIRLLRAAFAHAGALRIDHVMGLQRLYWVAPGTSAADGAYVAYPARELLGILALESRRHGALVVGEDLGTLPRGLPARLAQRGVLSSRVLYFEREADRFRPARRYSPRALVTANTHDLPPLAGFVAGRDLALRRVAGQLPDDAALDTARAEREKLCAGLRRRLVADRVLARGAGERDLPRLAGAVYRFLSRTPSPLLGVSLDDLAGEVEPVNLPGVPQERHASWSRRMGVPLEEIFAQPTSDAVLAALRTRRIRGGAS